MATQGWKQLLAGASNDSRRGPLSDRRLFRVHAAAAVGLQALRLRRQAVVRDDDPWGWHVTEYEEAFELAAGPGLAGPAKSSACCGTWAAASRRTASSADKLDGQSLLARRTGQSRRAVERALRRAAAAGPVRTQDDKGRVRWTLFGGSEQGPVAGVLAELLSGPAAASCRRSMALDFIRRLLHAAYGEPLARTGRSGAGRLSHSCRADEAPLALWRDEPLPSVDRAVRLEHKRTACAA